MQELDFLTMSVLRRMQYSTISLDEYRYWGTAESADSSSVVTLLKTGMIKHSGFCYGITEEGRAHIRTIDES